MRPCQARFAVAPAGALTLAQARIALANADLAADAGGGLALRWDDLGGADAAACERMRRDLRWLGVVWDVEIFQSERAGLYAAAAEKLKAARRLYPCFENDDELRIKREHRARIGRPIVYDRAMLKLTPAQRAAAEANGKRPYWRFLLSEREIAWKDGYLGRQQVKLPTLSDPVLVRADGGAQPSLAGAVDDIELGIGLCARSADDIANSAIQADIRAALGENPGRIALSHLPALHDADAGKRARGLEKLTLHQLRQDGIEAAALAAYLRALNAALDRPARFAFGELLAMNRGVVAALAYDAVAARLPEGADAAFWAAIRDHIDRLPEARIWWGVVHGETVAPILDGAADICAMALARMPDGPCDAGSWSAWLAALGIDAADPQAGLLYLALTGEEAGPPMDDLLPLLGRARAQQRLRAVA